MISVVIPNYNDPRIENTLKSITEQNTNFYEIILVEACVNNNLTKPIYKKYKKFIHKLIVEKDEGLFFGINKGLQLVKGEIVLIIGSDDYLSHNDIFKKVLEMFKDSDVHGVCLDCVFVDSRNKVVRKWKTKKITKQNISIGILPPHFSLFLKRSVYDKIGLFDTNLETLGLDSIWLMNLLKIENLKIKILNERATIMSIGGVSTKSFRNIFRGNINLMYHAREIGLKKWFLIPIIKILSKLKQFFIK